MSTTTEKKAHEFVFGYPNSETCSYVLNAGGERCGQPRSAAIHKCLCGHDLHSQPCKALGTVPVIGGEGVTTCDCELTLHSPAESQPCRECEETELHKLGCFFNRSLGDTERTRVLDPDRRPAPPTTEATDAPERLFINGENDYKHGVWTRERCAKGNLEYISAAAHATEVHRLREALRVARPYVEASAASLNDTGFSSVAMRDLKQVDAALNSEGKEQG